MILDNKLWEEDEAKNIYLKVSPESTEQINDFLDQIRKERKEVKIMAPQYYESLVMKWGDKLNKYPIALAKEELLVTFYAMESEVPLIFLEELKTLFRNIELSCYHRKSGTDLPYICHFVTKNTSLLSYSKNEDNPSETLKKIPFDSGSIFRDVNDRLIDFKAKGSGYLIYGEKGLQIIPPLINIINSYVLTLRLIPILTGMSDLVDFINSFLKNHKEKYPHSPIMNETISEDTIRHKGVFTYQEMDIVKGIKPQEGKDSRVILMKEESRKTNEDQNIDYHHVSQILTVSEGDIIAKKELVLTGTDGLDIYGKVQSVRKGTDKALKVGENIQIERFEREFHYLARITGMVIFKDNTLTLDETMFIKGDVDYHTGNLSYDKNIHITGDVRSGFEIDCKGNVLIEGSVEDNVMINCEGSLKIQKGILGGKTQIHCKGELTCGFIERANIICLSNLTVNRYILGGQVSSMGDINILGQSHSTQRVGALSGTDCRCFQNLNVLSLGANANKTRIYLGYNFLIEDKLVEVEKIVKGKQIRVSQFMEKIPFDLTSPQAINKLRQADKKTRDLVRSLLLAIKKSNNEIEELQNSRQELIKKRYGEDTNNFSILSKDGIKGPVSVFYGDREKEFQPKEGNVKIRYNNFEESFEIV